MIMKKVHGSEIQGAHSYPLKIHIFHMECLLQRCFRFPVNYGGGKQYNLAHLSLALFP